MSNTPGVKISFSNGNLLKAIPNIDGVAAIIGTAQQSANLGKIIIVHTLQEAEAAGITLSNEPFSYRHIKEFYDELGISQELYLLFVVNMVTLAQMLDSNANDIAHKLV